MSTSSVRKSVLIENIKNITRLEFRLPERPGVKLLVGTNGIGKTTLLTALNRIGDSSAFRNDLQIINTSGSSSIILNPYINTKFTYCVGEESFIYSQSKKGWDPKPRISTSELLSKFGYNDVIYIKADSTRFQPYEHPIWHSSISTVNAGLRGAVSRILQNPIFANMKGIILNGGRLVPVIEVGSGYYPENYFSTGELCVFKIVSKLYNARANSLVLIDEVDMTLHPYIQVNLLNYLRQIASARALTIIVSTHSVSMIKNTDKSDIYFLDDPKRDGNIVVEDVCYPAKALSGVGLQDQIDLDLVFLVEDDEARALLRELIDRYCMLQKLHYRPTFRIFPVGGWTNILRFHDEHHSVFGPNTEVYTFLDNDVTAMKKSKEFQDIINNHNKYIRYLPITPEPGILDFIQKNQIDAVSKLNLSRYNVNDFFSRNPIGSKTEEIKNVYEKLISELGDNTSGKKTSFEDMRRQVYNWYTEVQFTDAHSLKPIFGPCFNEFVDTRS